MAEYIDRKALRDALYDADAITMNGVKILNQFPAADVVPIRHGRWKLFRAGDWTTVYECSVYKRRVSVSGDKEKTDERVMKRYPYCSCGARMNDT